MRKKDIFKSNNFTVSLIVNAAIKHLY